MDKFTLKNLQLSSFVKEEVLDISRLQLPKSFSSNLFVKSINTSELNEVDTKKSYGIYDLEKLTGSALLKLFSSALHLPSGVYQYSCHLNGKDCVRTYVDKSIEEGKELMTAHLLNHVESLVSKAKKNPALLESKKFFPFEADQVKQKDLNNSCAKSRAYPKPNQLASPLSCDLKLNQQKSSQLSLKTSCSDNSRLNSIDASLVEVKCGPPYVNTRLRSGRLLRKIYHHETSPTPPSSLISPSSRKIKGNMNDSSETSSLEGESVTSGSESCSELEDASSVCNLKIGETFTVPDISDHFNSRFQLTPDKDDSSKSNKTSSKVVFKVNSDGLLSCHQHASDSSETPGKSGRAGSVKAFGDDTSKSNSHREVHHVDKPSPSPRRADLNTKQMRTLNLTRRTAKKSEASLSRQHHFEKNSSKPGSEEECLETMEKALLGLMNDHCYTKTDGSCARMDPSSSVEVPVGQINKSKLKNSETHKFTYRKGRGRRPQILTDASVTTSNNDQYLLTGPSSKKIEPSTDPKIKAKALHLIAQLRHRKPKEVMVCTVRRADGARSYVVQDFYSCEICGKRFTAPNSLYGHYRGHAGIKPFKCGVCGQTFTRSHSLSYHSMIHSNTTRFKCSFCDRTFRHPTHFKEHLNRHTGIEPYTCPDCPRRFRTRNTYRRHAITKHNRIVTPMGEYPVNSEVLQTVTWDK